MLGVLLAVVGALVGVVTLAAMLSVVNRVTRGGAGSAVSELSHANRVLEETLRDERQAKEQLGAEVRDLRVQLAELAGRTDFALALTAALAPIMEWTLGHERRASERHEAAMAAGARSTEALLGVLEQMARSLPPEPGNGGA